MRISFENKAIPPTKLTYRELQEVRQVNIRDAVLNPGTPVALLVNLYSVATDGLRLAVHYGATESDAQTFMNLQHDIRERLQNAHTAEVIQAAGGHALHHSNENSELAR